MFLRQKIHFIGIGGIGMSAIAKILFQKGFKILLNNYIIPFGIGFYLFYKSRFKNSFLLTTFVIYLCVFLIATPVHKIELKLLLLPYLWLFVFFYNKKTIFKTSD